MIYDVIVIGAGQAGLAMGYYLSKSKLNFLILDSHNRVGDTWRDRYDSLILFTPRSYSSLPGLALAGDPKGFPSKDEIADYLEHYAGLFKLPIKLNMHVKNVSKKKDTFSIQTQDSLLKAKKVVIATGPFKDSFIPPMSTNLSNDVRQLHSSQYKDPSQLKEGSVLVVGGGNSGAQIAVELSKQHETYLSVGQKITYLPLSIANQSIFWWFEKIGILKADRDSFIGRKIQEKPDPIFGYELKEQIQKGKVMLKSRTTSIDEDSIYFDDQTSVHVKNIIWATGFKFDYSWLDIPGLLDSQGKIIHQRGVTTCDGLFFLGLPWQHRRGSALLLGVGDDAKYLYEQIVI
jgi:putative flavoprotein involved in K+ transport